MSLRATNILFITSDQQRRDSLPCYGLDFMHTPSLDRLAREGVVFDNCVSASPVCQPCRAAFMSGQYPHVNGVPDNFRWLRPGTPTIADTFRSAGWETAAIGKMHFDPWDDPQGFEYRISAEDKRHFFRFDDHARFLAGNGYERRHPAYVEGYGEWLGAIRSPLPKELHIDSFIGQQAVRYLDSAGAKPFFCWVSFNSPHDPYDPPADLADLYRDAPIPEAVGNAGELRHKPAYQHQLIPFYRTNPLYLSDYSCMDEEKIRRMREYYLASVTLVDEQIGRILDVLDRRGMREETLVVFSSDHGDHLGDHGLPFKGTFYESSLKVPLIISAPGVPQGERARSFVDWIDLHRTFLAVAGIQASDHLQGWDICDLLVEPGLNGRTEAYSELLGRAMVCNDRYKLVVCDDGDGELYDMQEEPLEVVNHFADDQFKELRYELTDKLARHTLSHSRIRRFGGGVHASDPGRDQALGQARKTAAEGGFPGLQTAER